MYCDAQVYGAGLAPADQTSLGAVLKPRLEATVSALQLFSDSYRRDGASADSHLLAKSTQGLALYFTRLLSECVCQVHGINALDLCEKKCQYTLESIHHVIVLLTGSHGIGDHDIHVLHMVVLDVLMGVPDIVKHVFPIDASTGKLEDMQMHKIRQYCDNRSNDFNQKRFNLQDIKETRAKAMASYTNRYHIATLDGRSSRSSQNNSRYHPYSGNRGGSDQYHTSNTFENRPCALCSLDDHSARYCDLPGKIPLFNWMDRQVCFRCMKRHDGPKGHRCHLLSEPHPVFRDNNRRPGSLVSR